MSVIALIGAQWGDEGKGHIADKLAAESSIVARYNGGDNAGHTITVGERLIRTHLIPAGAFHLRSRCVLGAGMVINLRSLAREVDELNRLGANLSPARLKIDSAAHLLLPGHVALDGAREHALTAWVEVAAGRPNPLIDSLCADSRITRRLDAVSARALLDAREYVGDAPQRAKKIAARIQAT